MSASKDPNGVRIVFEGSTAQIFRGALLATSATFVIGTILIARALYLNRHVAPISKIHLPTVFVIKWMCVEWIIMYSHWGILLNDFPCAMWMCCTAALPSICLHSIVFLLQMLFRFETNANMLRLREDPLAEHGFFLRHAKLFLTNRIFWITAPITLGFHAMWAALASSLPDRGRSLCVFDIPGTLLARVVWINYACAAIAIVAVLLISHRLSKFSDFDEFRFLRYLQYLAVWIVIPLATSSTAQVLW